MNINASQNIIVSVEGTTEQIETFMEDYIRGVDAFGFNADVEEEDGLVFITNYGTTENTEIFIDTKDEATVRDWFRGNGLVINNIEIEAVEID